MITFYAPGGRWQLLGYRAGQLTAAAPCFPHDTRCIYKKTFLAAARPPPPPHVAAVTRFGKKVQRGGGGGIGKQLSVRPALALVIRVLLLLLRKRKSDIWAHLFLQWPRDQ